jgi:hypothetical protein
MLRQLLRIFPHLLAFYLITAVLAVAGMVPWYYVLARNKQALLPVGAALGAALLLIYARLLGRLAWLIHRLNPPRPKPAWTRKKVSEAKAVAAPAERRKRKKRKKPKPPRPTDGYGLAEDDEPPAAPEPAPKRERRPWEDEPAQPYGLADEEPPSRPPAETPLDGYNAIGVEPPSPDDPKAPPEEFHLSPLEKMLRERASPDPPPAWPLFSGVYLFPWYGTSLGYWLALALGFLLVGFGVRLVLDLSASL